MLCFCFASTLQRRNIEKKCFIVDVTAFMKLAIKVSIKPLAEVKIINNLIVYHFGLDTTVWRIIPLGRTSPSDL